MNSAQGGTSKISGFQKLKWNFILGSTLRVTTKIKKFLHIMCWLEILCRQLIFICQWHFPTHFFISKNGYNFIYKNTLFEKSIHQVVFLRFAPGWNFIILLWGKTKCFILVRGFASEWISTWLRVTCL